MRPARWFHLDGEQQRGPLGLDQVRAEILAGRIHPDDFVWSDGMPDWMHARDVPALIPPAPLRARIPEWS